MRLVKLQFPTILELVDFTLEVAEKACEVRRSHLVLICKLVDADIELAKLRYRAVELL